MITGLPEMRRYVKQIRNASKKRYAKQYLAFLSGNRASEPEMPELAYMAKQGVRMALLRLHTEATLDELN